MLECNDAAMIENVNRMNLVHANKTIVEVKWFMNILFWYGLLGKQRLVSDPFSGRQITLWVNLNKIK